MALYKLEDFDPNYRDTFQGDDIKGLGVYAEGTDDKIGSVSDVLVDDEGHFRYLVVDLGFWIFGKKVLLPIGRARIDYNVDRVYAIGMTRQQADDLPEFNERSGVDYDYEERVRGVYRRPGDLASNRAVESTSTLESATPVDAAAPLDRNYQPAVTPTPTYNRDTYRYEHEPSLFGINEADNQTLRLYEERLIANKKRQKAGEVAIGKRVETDTARVAVPLERERVVIERVTPTDAGTAVTPGEANFREGEVARVELYEETPDIRKETVVREEVRVKKVVEQETSEAQATVRREELDVDTTGGLPIEER
ncbi:PRC-barrel domain-containing protein AvaK [Nostoc carneum NIES-2107]|nr:PRC-barrel domain-containing protein AvaK [Nostoc carneum NIES-2107]